MESLEIGIHRTKRDQVILDLTFRGGRWRCDSEIREAIADVVEAFSPAAILLDLSEFRYRGGDYASGFVAAFVDSTRGGFRPACFVGAPHGVKGLFDAIDISGTLGVRYFDHRAEALDSLRTRLEPSGPPLATEAQGVRRDTTR